MKIKQCFALLLLVLPALAFSQTAAEMDSLLGANTVSGAAAARFVLEAADLLPGGLSGAEAEKAAWETASSKGWVKTASTDAFTLKDTAFLIMRAFDLKGGFMYSASKSPRYAYREMVYHKMIQGRADPAMEVSGSRFLQILGSALSYSGEEGGVK